MKTWYKYKGRENKKKDQKLNPAKLALISEFCK